MYGLLKLLYHAIITGRDFLNVKNALQYVPNPCHLIVKKNW